MKTRIISKLVELLESKLVEARNDNPYEISISGLFMFGRHIVRYAFKPRGCEIEIYNPVLDTFLDRVSIYAEKCVISWHQVEVKSETIWEQNGFRDEADYLNWKYG